MSLIPQFKTELQYIPTVKACLKLCQVDCFCLRLKGSLESQNPAAIATELDEKSPKLTIRGPIRKKYEKKQVCYC